MSSTSGISTLDPSPGTATKNTVRVLVVDDNREAAEILAKLLRLMGHEVCTAYRGLAALEEAEELSPQVVLIDLSMPGMDGFELASRLRDRPLPDRATLVAITGWVNDSCRQRAYDAGFDHFLTKPVNINILNELLSQPWLTAPQY